MKKKDISNYERAFDNKFPGVKSFIRRKTPEDYKVTSNWEELTVGDVLRWVDKLKKLESEGAIVVHVKLLLEQQRQEAYEEGYQDGCNDITKEEVEMRDSLEKGNNE